jgi:hypothetical protein
MLEAIRQATGPVWAFLVRVATLLEISVSIREIGDRLRAAKAAPETIKGAREAALVFDANALDSHIRAALEDEGDPQWDRLWALYHELSVFIFRPSWGTAKKLAQALSLCENEDVIAAVLVAATTAAPRPAFAEE